MKFVIQLSEVISNIASLAAVIGACSWFFYTAKIRRRLQFDIDCRFFALQRNSEKRLLELQFIFINTGFVEHRLWNLNVSIHTLDANENISNKDQTQEVQFPIRLLPMTQLVPKKYGYFFVRPGVRQLITHIVAIPADVSVIRVTASFDYTRDEEYPHTARRIFQVGDQFSHKASVER